MTPNPHDRNSHRKMPHSSVRKGVALFLPRLGHGGFSLIETLITLTIFSIVMAGVYEAYISQMKHTSREYRLAEADVELGVALNILVNDVEMAGYGLAEDYTGALDGSGNTFNPRAVQATNAADATEFDTLTLMGTGLGLTSTGSRASQRWTYISSVPGVVAGNPLDFKAWGDAREDVGNNDRVILMEPSTKKLLLEGSQWLFRYNGPNALPTTVGGTGAPLNGPTVGTLAYGLHDNTAAAAAQPYYAVSYYLGSGTNPTHCASGTRSLLRAESAATEAPGTGKPLMTCVRDFQVEFRLDTNEDGTGDTWDPGGTIAATNYSARNLRRRLKEVRVYILAQVSDRDPNYTYPSGTIRVGDTTLGTGRDVVLTDAEKNYRWQVISLNISPRNIR